MDKEKSFKKTEVKNMKETHCSLQEEKLMLELEPGEEIVITGISGVFPSCNNVHEYRDNLFNKVNMVLPNRRFKVDQPEIPPCSGAIPIIDRYDTGFFGVHQRQSDSLDPQISVLQEKTVEAIFDAGLHPSDLENTRTGVFTGINISENEGEWFFRNLLPNTYAITGSQRSMAAHRLSYFLKLRGPSCVVDSACSTSLHALENAYRSLVTDEIDNAIVAASHLCLYPSLTLQFSRLGVLNKDGICKPFDADGNGYARSEAVAVIFLQRAKNAKRIYSKVVHVKTSCDGFKEQGITFLSREDEIQLLIEFYNTCKIDRYSLSFLEAHGTGTLAGDPEECYAIDTVFTKERTRPLLIGSVRSNMGHSEPASGLCSIIKCIIGMETGFIPPNIHYEKPRPELKGLTEGRLKVVTEKMPFEDNHGLIGINSFGIGGAISHLLMHWNDKTKREVSVSDSKLPRLACVSGRTEDAVITLLDSIANSNFNDEYIKLLHNGFSIQRMIIEEVNIEDLFQNKSSNEDEGYIFGNVIVQLGLIHILCELEVAATSVGHSTGELISAYFHGSLSLEETISYAFSIDQSLFKITKTLESASNAKMFEVFAENYGVVDDVTKDNSFRSTSNIVNNEENKMNNFPLSLIYNNFELMTNDLIESVSQELVYKGYRDLKVTQFINAIFNKVHPKINVNQQYVILNIDDDSKLEMSENYSCIPIFSEDANYFTSLLNSLGRLYEYGYNPQIGKLYNSVQWPVSRGTGMISPYIKWNHSKLKHIPVHKPQSTTGDHRGRTIIIQKEDPMWHYLKGHVIDGRNLFPAVGFIYLVWETFSNIKKTPIIMTKVYFKNCKFIRAVIIPAQKHLALSINIQSGSGNFEVTHENSVVVTGNISLLDSKENNYHVYPHKNNEYLENNNINLTSKDFYKELRLRGYDYMAEFHAVEECNSTATNAYIKWEKNWVTFMDNMLQISILQYDTRLLYVPTFISKLTILATDHIAFVNSKLTQGVTPVLPVTNDKVVGKLSSGGITFLGLTATAISRKKILDSPILQSYMFIPNFTVLDIYQSVRVNIQMIVENAGTYKIKGVELIDHFTNKNILPLMPIVKSVLEDEPFAQPFLKILTKMPIEDLSVETKDEELSSETDCLLVIASKILDRPDVMKEACASLIENGFIISRESHNYNVTKKVVDDLKIFTLHETTDESIVLLQKQTKIKQVDCIKINSEKSFAWLPKVQSAITNKNNIILYAENEHNNGILGLFNCLKKEPLTKNVRCVFIMEQAEEFSPHIPFYSTQLHRGMAVNIYKYGQWGTYRYLPLKKREEVESEHCFINMASRGDLSSLRWSEGLLRHHMKQEPAKEFIYVYYSSLNFRDIMTATGGISVDTITLNRVKQECIEGFEFAGRNSKGDRVMGMTAHGAFSTLLLLSDVHVLFKVPDDWSLEEAATVPTVYATVIYSLILRGQMVRGETILIHSGTGGIGQAAIRIALHYGCRVFTTVGTKEKRDALKKIFPQLKDHHIGNSHDESFEQLVLRYTNGRGMDVILNSLAEEKLQASIRCLARGGRFIEIGKIDIARNNEIKTLLFQKEASCHGVMLDHLFAEGFTGTQKVAHLVEEGIKNGIIKPLRRIVFKYNEIEQAFRCMASGKHMGKVLVQLREPEKEFCISQLKTSFVGTPR